MITILCEKSSAASNFAKALGGYTGTLNGDSYEIVWAAGHLFEMSPIEELVPKDDIGLYTSWELDMLPFDRHAIRWSVSLKHTKNTKSKNNRAFNVNYDNRIAAIANSLTKADTCIIATDVDSSCEGDLLAWEIIQYLQFKGKVYRCSHSDESATSIKRALTPANLEAVDASCGALQRGLARQRFDYLTIQYARVTTTVGRLRQVIPYNMNTREGRLKTAMLSLIGSSEYAHELFKPSSRFTSSYVDTHGHVFIKNKSSEFDEKSDAERLVNKMESSTVKELDEGKISHRKPPKMFDLSIVSARMAKMGYSGDKLLSVANQMYHDSVLSYPRTDDKQITTEQLKEMLPLVPQIATLVGVDSELIDIHGFRKASLSNEQLSHGANRPGLSVPDSRESISSAYGEIGLVLYDLLARSFLAQFAPDAEYLTKTYSDQSGEYTYSVTTNKSRGYEIVLNPDLKEDTLVDAHGDLVDLDNMSDDERAELDVDNVCVTVGDTLTPSIREKKAKRPAKATQTSLMRYLETNGIGTGATRTSTLVEISMQNRNKKKKVDDRLVTTSKTGAITLTDLGKVSFLLMKGTLLAEPSVTKELDNRLEKVQSGELTIEQVLKTFDQMFLKDKATIMQNAARLSSLPKQTGSYAPREKVTGTFKPTGKTVTYTDTWSNHKFTDDENAELLAGHEISFYIPIDKTKSLEDLKGDRDQMCKVFGVLRDDGDKFGFGFKQTKREYPKRASIKGVYKPTGEEITFSAKFGQYELKPEEAETLLAGNTITITAPKKAGGTYTATLELVYGDKWGSKTGEKCWQMAFANKKPDDN